MNLKVGIALLLFTNLIVGVSLKNEADLDEDFFLDLTPAEIIQAEILKGRASLMHTEHEVDPISKHSTKPKTAPTPVLTTPQHPETISVPAGPGPENKKNSMKIVKDTESTLVDEIVSKITGISTADAKKAAAHHKAKSTELQYLQTIEQELITKIVERLKLVHKLHPDSVISAVKPPVPPVPPKPVNPSKVVISESPEVAAQDKIVAAIKSLLGGAAHSHQTKISVPATASTDHKHFTVIVGHDEHTSKEATYKAATVYHFHHHLTQLINKVYHAQKETCSPTHPCYPPLPKHVVPIANKISQSCDALIIPKDANMTASMAQPLAPVVPVVSKEHKPTQKHDEFAENMLKQIANLRAIEHSESSKHAKEEAHLKHLLDFQKKLSAHKEQAQRLADAKRLHTLLTTLSHIRSMVLGTTHHSGATKWTYGHAPHPDIEQKPPVHPINATHHHNGTHVVPTHPCSAGGHHNVGHKISHITDGLKKLQAEQRALQQKLWVEHYFLKNHGKPHAKTPAAAHAKAPAAAHPASFAPTSVDPSVIHNAIIQPFGHH